MAKFTDINKNNSFGVPKDYFDSLNDQIHSKISEEKLKDEYGDENPFIVPKNYFKDFNVKILNRNTSKIIKVLKPYLSIAAGILLIFTIWQVTLSILENRERITDNTENNLYTEDMQYAEIFDFSNNQDL